MTPRRPLIMGILNVTPDSFSDGGEFIDQQFTQTPYPVLIGASKKAFIGKILGTPQEPLDPTER